MASMVSSWLCMVGLLSGGGVVLGYRLLTHALSIKSFSSAVWWYPKPATFNCHVFLVGVFIKPPPVGSAHDVS